MEMITLNDGNKIPAVGFGVFLVPNDGPAYEAVSQALKVTAISIQQQLILTNLT